MDTAEQQLPPEPQAQAQVETPQGSSTAPQTQAENPDPTHSEPLLTYGATGASVRRLVELLGRLGFNSNSVIQGENPSALFDESVMADVRRFWAEYGVEEHPQEFEGHYNVEGDIVGPVTWQKLYDETGVTPS